MAFKMRYQSGARQKTAPLYQSTTNVSTGETIKSVDAEGNIISRTPTTTTITTPGSKTPPVVTPKVKKPSGGPRKPFKNPALPDQTYEEFLAAPCGSKGKPCPDPKPPSISSESTPPVVTPPTSKSSTTWAETIKTPPYNPSTGMASQTVNENPPKGPKKKLNLRLRLGEINWPNLNLNLGLFGARGLLNPRTWGNCKGGGCARNPR